MYTARQTFYAGLLGAALLCPSAGSAQPIPVIQMATGEYHSLFLKRDRALWGMGGNLDGQLGNGYYSIDTNRPELIVASEVVGVAAGTSHSLFIKSDGTLWGMGLNNAGELGNGNNAPTAEPTQVWQATNVIAAAAGDAHSLFVRGDGTLWAMGLNDSGQLGNGTTDRTAVPVQISSATNVTAVAAGQGFSLFLESDGSLWGMGASGSGQLGDGARYNSTNLPEKIVDKGVTVIAAGGVHSLFLKSDGSLWGMGNNNSGQLGAGSFYNSNPTEIVASNVTAIAAGNSISLFVKTDGSLWGMGDAGIPAATFAPAQIVPSGVTAVASGCGSSHCLFRKLDGSLWSMGNDSNGQLGDGAFSYGTHTQPKLIVDTTPSVVVSNSLLIADGLSRSVLQLDLNISNMAPFIASNNFVGYPNGMAFGPDGNLYVLDTDYSSTFCRVLKFNPTNGAALGTFVNNGAGVSRGNFLAFDANGNLYVESDTSPFVTAFSPSGFFMGSLVTSGTHLPNSTAFGCTGIGIGPDNRIYLGISDTSAGYVGDIVRLDLAGGYVDTPVNNVGSGNGFRKPLWDAAGNFYVCNLNDGVIRKFNGYSGTLMQTIDPPANGYAGMSFTRNGDLAVGDIWSQYIYRVATNGTYLGIIASNVQANDILQQPVHVAPTPAGIVGATVQARTNLLVHGVNGVAGAMNLVLASTNLMLPKTQWTCVGTNNLSQNGDFTFTLTNSVTPGVPRRFYILQTQ